MRKLGLVAVVSLMVVLLGTSLAFGQRYEAKKAQGPIVIDGDLSEWEGLPTIQITAEDGGLLTLMCQWDEEFLYFALIAEDDVHYNPFTEDLLWRADCFQIALDTLTTKGSGYDDDDLEYGWALTEEGGLETWAWKVPVGVEFDPDLMVFAIVPSTDDYFYTIYEVAVPKALLGPAKLESGFEMDFNFVVNDHDGFGRTRVEWTYGTASTKYPNFFGTLALVD